MAIFGAGSIFLEAGGEGRVVGCGCGRLARVARQRDAGPGAVSPAHPKHGGGSALAGMYPSPLACHFASLERRGLRFSVCCCLWLELCVGGGREGLEEAG